MTMKGGRTPGKRPPKYDHTELMARQSLFRRFILLFVVFFPLCSLFLPAFLAWHGLSGVYNPLVLAHLTEHYAERQTRWLLSLLLFAMIRGKYGNEASVWTGLFATNKTRNNGQFWRESVTGRGASILFLTFSFFTNRKLAFGSKLPFEVDSLRG